MSVVVTVRLDREIREKAKRYKVNISQVAREALREEIARKEREELLDDLGTMKRILKKIPSEEIVQALRESRDER